MENIFVNFSNKMSLQKIFLSRLILHFIFSNHHFCNVWWPKFIQETSPANRVHKSNWRQTYLRSVEVFENISFFNIYKMALIFSLNN